MSGTCPIVTIKTKDGPVDINAHHYDPKVHTLHENSDKVPEKTDNDAGYVPVEPFKVGKNGKKGGASKFIVTDANDKKVGDTEYATEAEAWAAIIPAIPPQS